MSFLTLPKCVGGGLLQSLGVLLSVRLSALGVVNHVPITCRSCALGCSSFITSHCLSDRFVCQSSSARKSPDLEI